MDTKESLGTLINHDDLIYLPEPIKSPLSSSTPSSLSSSSPSLPSSPVNMCPPQSHKSPSPTDCCIPPQSQRISSQCNEHYYKIPSPPISCPSQQQPISINATLPSMLKKPRKIILEKWQPYEKVKRRVIFQPAPPDPVYIKPRNVIVQWQVPNVTIKQQIRHLGEIRANPIKYASKYSNLLIQPKDLPQYILDIAPPNGVVLASDTAYNPVHELEGDIDALKLVDLDREGLSEYKSVLNSSRTNLPHSNQNLQQISSPPTSTFQQSQSQQKSSNLQSQPPPLPTTSKAIDEIFRLLYNKETGRIKVNRAARVVLKVNSRLGRKYGEDDVKHFIRALDINGDGTLSLNEFREAFATLVL